jgi:hypothetical protein
MAGADKIKSPKRVTIYGTNVTASISQILRVSGVVKVGMLVRVTVFCLTVRQGFSQI